MVDNTDRVNLAPGDHWVPLRRKVDDPEKVFRRNKGKWTAPKIRRQTKLEALIAQADYQEWLNREAVNRRYLRQGKKGKPAKSVPTSQKRAQENLAKEQILV